MKNIFILFIGAMMWSCADDNSGQELETLNTMISVGQGETFSIVSDNEVIAVISSSIDARCPSDVNCISAGSYQASLLLTEGDDSVEVELCNWHCGAGFTENDTSFFELNNVAYGVILKDMIPYPTTQNQEEEKDVVLEFFKR